LSKYEDTRDCGEGDRDRSGHGRLTQVKRITGNSQHAQYDKNAAGEAHTLHSNLPAFDLLSIAYFRRKGADNLFGRAGNDFFVFTKDSWGRKRRLPQRRGKPNDLWGYTLGLSRRKTLTLENLSNRTFRTAPSTSAASTSAGTFSMGAEGGFPLAASAMVRQPF
jgi:hypothetical protein